MNDQELKQIIEQGEGDGVEFKESCSKLDRELVAFANGLGGNLYLGIADSGEIKGIGVNNRLMSSLQDLARNCDPPIDIDIHKIRPDGYGVQPDTAGLMESGSDKP